MIEGLKIATLNVNGIADKNKRKKIFKMIKQMDCYRKHTPQLKLKKNGQRNGKQTTTTQHGTQEQTNRKG